MESKSLCVFLSILLLSSNLSFCSAFKFPNPQAALSYLKNTYKDTKPYVKGADNLQGLVGDNEYNCGGPVYCPNGYYPKNYDHCSYAPYEWGEYYFYYVCEGEQLPCVSNTPSSNTFSSNTPSSNTPSSNTPSSSAGQLLNLPRIVDIITITVLMMRA